MLSFLKWASGARSSEPVPVGHIDPAAHNLVIEDDESDDGFTEVTMRPMTYAEVAGKGVVGRRRISTGPPVDASATGLTTTISLSPPRELSTEILAHELYGDDEDDQYRIRPGKGLKRHRSHRLRERR